MIFLHLVLFLIFSTNSYDFWGVSKVELPLEKEYLQAKYSEGNKVLNFLEIFGYKAQKLYKDGNNAYRLLTGKKVNTTSRHKARKVSYHPTTNKPPKEIEKSSPHFLLGASGNDDCDPDMYTPQNSDSNCTSYKHIECGFLIKNLTSITQCSGVERNANPFGLCLEYGKGKEYDLKFGIKCHMEQEVKGFSCDGSEEVCVTVTDTTTRERTLILYMAETFNISISISAYNFNRMSNDGERKEMKSTKLTQKDLQYRHSDTLDETSFTNDNNISFTVGDEFMNYVVTNRLSLELSASIPPKEMTDKLNSIHFSPVWFYVDFPNNKIPRYRLKPLTSFQIVVIVLAVFIGLVIIIATIHLLYKYYQNYKDEKEDLEKEQAQREKRRHQQEQEMEELAVGDGDEDGDGDRDGKGGEDEKEELK